MVRRRREKGEKRDITSNSTIYNNNNTDEICLELSNIFDLGRSVIYIVVNIIISEM